MGKIKIMFFLLVETHRHLKYKVKEIKNEYVKNYRITIDERKME